MLWQQDSQSIPDSVPKRKPTSAGIRSIFELALIGSWRKGCAGTNLRSSLRLCCWDILLDVGFRVVVRNLLDEENDFHNVSLRRHSAAKRNSLRARRLPSIAMLSSTWMATLLPSLNMKSARSRPCVRVKITSFILLLSFGYKVMKNMALIPKNSRSESSAKCLSKHESLRNKLTLTSFDADRFEG